MLPGSRGHAHAPASMRRLWPVCTLRFWIRCNCGPNACAGTPRGSFPRRSLLSVLIWRCMVDSACRAPSVHTPVQRIRYADNETNYCPGCQTGGRLLADRALSRLLKQDWPKSVEGFDRES